MISLSIDISDVLAKLARLNDAELARVIADAVADGAVLPEWAKEPRQTHAVQPFVSTKQRRYFFMALKKGLIEVPYRRTGNMGAYKNWAKQPKGNGLTLVNTAKGVDVVRVAATQSKYHKGNWTTDEQVAQKIENDTAEIIGTAKVLEKLQQAGLT